MSKNLYIKTFGCQMNERDSEIIEQLLAQEGYVATAEPKGADLILINTCSIREKAEQKVFSLLGSLRPEKQKNPKLLLGVTGCVAQQEGEQIRERMPHVDLIVGTQQIYRLPELLDRLSQGVTNKEIATNMEASFSIPPFQKLLNNTSPSLPAAAYGFKRFVTIMQGCDNFCSYCVVPGTRGREISRPMADILEEVEILVSQGVREITLLGQNVNSYGTANQVAEQPVDFPRLLREVAAIKGVQRLRFTTSHPKDLTEELMRCFAEIDNLCPHFHLPVQSGSNAVLRRMNRKYTVESYLEKVELLRRYRPDIALATDIIVGFPGETDDDFQATMDLLNRVRFHGSFSFKYSDRPHTRSAEFGDKIPEEVKSARLAVFQERQDAISFERNREQIGKKVEVMIEGVNETGLKGRSAGNHMVHCSDVVTSLLPGDLATVRIQHAGKHSLKGVLEN
ncbi:MAG: tRNA (N6-isopentenyl adenosine(37)-C2)-methylthiotransferase MiaB [Desulfobulbus sp.]|jgi:tRNA-2-methylthio-N6-dimethylallyladenosine synthase|uniref:tRNA (N6-isopentenyl adenosine(37)-C2)-methylthiotransferase MiaB n=1 Tax=Desulfobulbus sp. TaxID=895 RepID=UPI00283EADDC|nr:tRNA (N6-isopentenyl adenosine(37)-C2)-methylthiotransferase MiaB [Desulfobulbus sp.]MDR2549269.1 tRNA (N6-isopentenyl adenosine(37)-C2)-methylthiotransferase MiaB [Desulfobulbus sp.]